LLKKLLREPLLHFLLIGALLFVIYGLQNDGISDQSKRIVFTQADINRLAWLWEKQRQRPPTQTELRGLIEQQVREQVFYREALVMEIVHGNKSRPGVAARWPWLVAFIFGLLHGFGFAGALAEVGLPQQAIPLALVFFNIGVEIGQIMFVASVVLLGWMLHRLKYQKYLDWAETAVVYSIGGISSFWVFERASAF